MIKCIKNLVSFPNIKKLSEGKCLEQLTLSNLVFRTKKGFERNNKGDSIYEKLYSSLCKKQYGGGKHIL